MTRQFFGQPDGEKWDYPDRGIGYRNALVLDRATGKYKHVYHPVEYHYVWEVAYLISAAGKPMGEANVRKMIRQGKLCAVKWNPVIEEFVAPDAALALDSTVPWQVSTESLREYFAANGLLKDISQEERQVPADVTPPVDGHHNSNQIAAIGRNTGNGDSSGVIRKDDDTSQPTELPQVPDVAPGPVVTSPPVERPQVPAVAPGPIVTLPPMKQSQVPAGRAAASIPAKSRGTRHRGRWLVVAAVICIVLVCALAVSGLFVVGGNTGNPPTSTLTPAPKNVCEQMGLVLCPDGLACCAK
jgi:hypothetical protein